jgi:hypothetical protein
VPFLTQGKTNWKFLLIVIILAVIVGGEALWLSIKQEIKPPEIKKNEKVSFEQLSNCTTAPDCVLVSHKSCGGAIKISINKKYEPLYNSTLGFQDSTGEICKTLGISYDEEKQIVESQVPTESLCVNNKCVPKYLEDAIANWKNYKNEGHNYEIKYPSSWFLSEYCEGIAGQPNYCLTKKAGFSSKETYDKISQENRVVVGGIPNNDDINIWVFNKSEYPVKSLKDYVIYQVSTIEGYKIEQTKIEEKKSDQGLDYFLYTNPTITTYQSAFFEYGDKFYTIESHADLPYSNIKIEVFNRMLSTFKIEAKECLKDGQIIKEKELDPMTRCCGNLSLINVPNGFDDRCNYIVGSDYVCTNCGNKICEKNETLCNCWVDCQKTDEPLLIKVSFPILESFNMNDNSFEVNWYIIGRSLISPEVDGQNIKIITSTSTEIYDIAPNLEGKRMNEFTFTGFKSQIENWNVPKSDFYILGTFQDYQTIKADEIYWEVQ